MQELAKPWLLQSQLLLALRNQDVIGAEKLFQSGVDIDSKFLISGNEKAAISIAVENDDFEMVSLMLQLGASPNRRDSKGQTPLHIACEFGFLSIVQLLTRNHGQVETVDDNGQSPFHLSVKFGKKDIVNYFVTNSQLSDLNKTDKFGHSVLHYAASLPDSDILDTLLNVGADPNILDKYGNTPLHFAVGTQGTDCKGIRKLASASPTNVFTANTEEKNPLHLIVSNQRQEQEDILKILLNTASLIILKNPPEFLSSPSHRGHSPLHLAVLERKYNLVRILISYGSTVNTKDLLEKTPLDCAILDNNFEIVKLLLSAGASLRDSSLHRLLYCTSYVRDEELRRILVQSSTQPKLLTRICRIILCQKFGPIKKDIFKEFPRSWLHFVSFKLT